MSKTGPLNEIIETAIDDSELIIYVKGVFNLKTIGVGVKDFTPDFGDMSQFNRVCVDLTHATRLDATGLDYLNAYYHAAKDAGLGFRASGVSEIMIKLFSMSGVTWPFKQREMPKVVRRRRRHR